MVKNNKDLVEISKETKNIAPSEKAHFVPVTPKTDKEINEPQTIAEQIASSSNPDLEFQKYLYQTNLQNIFTQYQKNIAGLDEARQKDIADSYFIREMSKKYLGEYASNIGVGDVSGNLVDIYANYASNLADINLNYKTLEAEYEAKMNESTKTIAQELLSTEIGLKLSEYSDTLLQAQTDVMQGIQNGVFGEFSNYTDYINSLELPENQKQDLLEWAKTENEYFEKTSFTQIKGMGVNENDLQRFGLSAQPNIDISYYTSADVLSDYAYMRNGSLYGVETEETLIPESALTDFNYQRDGNGFITYKGDTYVYLSDGTFHKMVQVESEYAKIPSENGLLLDENISFYEKTVIVNGTTYKRSGTDIVSFVNNLDDKSLKQLQELVDTNFSGEKVFFYNGLYYSITFKEGKLKNTKVLKKE